jgi:hypothetical protein
MKEGQAIFAFLVQGQQQVRGLASDNAQYHIRD